MKTGSERLWPLVIIVALISLCTSSASTAQNARKETADVVLRLPAPVTVPVGTVSKVHRVNLRPEQQRDRWIRAFHFEPGDARVVRCAFFYVERTGQWLGAWTPGQGVFEYPDTVAAYLPVGSSITVEIHYAGAASDVQDVSSLGLFFTETKPLRPLTEVGVASRVDVPLGPQPYRLHKEFTIISDSYALGLRPEMNSFGQSFEVATLDPSGASQVLLSVKEYRHDLQSAYTFEQPLFMAKGTRIMATALYRNEAVQLADDVFKLSMTLYPSAEYRLTSYDARPTVKARTAKRAAPAKKAPAKKRPAQKKPSP
jgi:hypothetical protein